MLPEEESELSPTALATNATNLRLPAEREQVSSRQACLMKGHVDSGKIANFLHLDYINNECKFRI